jgi:hypothetical protein
MPDRHFNIDGYLVAEADVPSHAPRCDVSQRDRLLLFGDERGWTLLTIHRLTTWRENGPLNIRATTASVSAYSDPAALVAEHGNAVWQALVEAAARRGVELQNPPLPLEDQ